LPVRIKLPFPGILVASTKRMSPPTGVQAIPVATPGTLVRDATSLSNLGGPRIARMSSLRITIAARSGAPRTLSRQRAAIRRSASRRAGTVRPDLAFEAPASRIPACMANDLGAARRPRYEVLRTQAVVLLCPFYEVAAGDSRASRPRVAGMAMTSQRVPQWARIASRTLAVAMKSTLLKSNGTAM
jgi:hypothetical protein